tara:strand:- start:60 stop:470 length:411 start_codon:yes stop_codon:yes gene_type:complete
MSFIYSAALQSAIYTALTNAAPISTLIGSNVFDAVPSGTVADTYILLGEEKVFSRSDFSSDATRHDVVVNVVSTANGFSDAKMVASEICKVLDGAALTLSVGNLRRLQFRSAKSRRDTGAAERRIDLIFRALVDEV